MAIPSSSYSPRILIYLKFGNKSIRIADVLKNSARLYSKSFDEIEKGTKADLVFSIDDQETSQQICLHQGLSPNMEYFDFQNV